MPRIVSMIASATEIVCALGFERDLVGRSHECDFPPSVMRLPVCTSPRFDVQGTSEEIDRRVKSLLADASSIYEVNVELLERFRPDVIVTQGQCEVCAVSDKDVAQALRSLPSSLPALSASEGAIGASNPALALGAGKHMNPLILSLSPTDLAGVWQSIRNVADALGVSMRGEELVGRLQSRVDDIASRTPEERPTVACLEWLNPLMAAGNWVPELVELAGGSNKAGAAGKHSPWLTLEQLIEIDPMYVIAMPCGFDLRTTLAEMNCNLPLRDGWRRLRAVREGRVFAADGNQYFNRPGPRLVESLEILAEIVHPGRFTFGHENRGWQRYQPLAA